MFCLVFAGPAIISELQGSKTQGFLLFFCCSKFAGPVVISKFEPWKTQGFLLFQFDKVNPLGTLAALTFKNSRFFAFFFGPRSSFVGSVAFFFWKT